MKLIKTQMTPLVKNFLHIEKREQPFLYSPYHGRPTFHAHPEFELTYILKGHGERIIGNNLSSYSEGDMVFLGSNVPHIWLSDPAFYQNESSPGSRAIVAYVNPKIFEQMFDLLKEFESIKEMTTLASRGFRIYGETKQLIAEKLKNLFKASGYFKIEGFMSIMHTIATSHEKEFILDSRLPLVSYYNSDRLIPVIQYIKNNLADNITLRMLADITSMTVPSFCRFFKNRMNTSPFQYIMEERMKLARKLLIELDKPVYEIAMRCGYNSDSHFCKIFKEHYGISPYRYKSSVTRLSTLAES